MSAAKQALWVFMLLATLAFSSWYFARHNSLTPVDPETLDNSVDSVVTNLRVRQFDTNGQLLNFLESPLMQHIPHENTNLFFSPHFTLGQPKQADWDIKSNSAKSLHNGEQISFIGSVVIHQDQSEANQASTMKTEALDYFPKKKFATTPLLVKFEQPGSTIVSKGMNAYLEDKHVELLSKARVKYEPKKAA